ncbi:SDR family oxidoreductase [Salinibacterium sp. NK8237]|uniref:SDR family NAD(P)-dependent oxidoreductase n=1 Tax=Salinibacterium sp. NK8237 TaxID=2792038 RepID=UPI0018CF0301|nr:SDR family NAD(P)-dependent oxidoreductase [Salinibacterium sp. NK8237]MBH0129261.1 SDR family NAD(P)-dependent oxidoreductase [Salinibacterium sp. NK8237]
MATALITGGTSGIGAEFARQLAHAGTDLVLVARNEDRLTRTAAVLSATFGISVETISADLADRTDVSRVAERLTDLARPIDLFVNNAGFGVHAKLTDPAAASVHEHAFDVMCRAVLLLGGAAGYAMRERGTGSIINVASIAGLVTMGSYSAIKAWVASYSQGLSVELRGSGVTVTALMPGWVVTEFHERAGIRTSSIPDFMWMDAAILVRGALRDASRGKVVSIPTIRYRLIGWFARHLPQSTIRSISAKISSSRSDEGSEPRGVKDSIE